MKTYLSLIFLITSFVLSAQELQLKKASPFTAVKWDENDHPIVRYQNEWYPLIKLQAYTSEELITFSKQEYRDKWKKRFSEDLVELLSALGTTPEKKVEIVILKQGKYVSVTGEYTFENRQKVYQYNILHPEKNEKPKEISISEAINDIEEFRAILKKKSSYIHLTTYDFNKVIDTLKHKIQQETGKIDVNYLSLEIGKIVAAIGDRHSSVTNEIIELDPDYNLQLPFTITAINGKVAALTPTSIDGKYQYYSSNYPFLRAINNLTIPKMIDSLVYRSRKAPKEAKFIRGIDAIQSLGALYLKNNMQLPKDVIVQLSNGIEDTLLKVNLERKNQRIFSKLQRDQYANAKQVEQNNFEAVSRIINKNIGYISIPRMYDLDEYTGLKNHLDTTLKSFKNTKALIIDLRSNPGGVRDLVNYFAKYIIQPSNSPWIANIAYLRTDEKKDTYPSMESRYLYPYDSRLFNENEKLAIKAFIQDFKIDTNFERSFFSRAHYMVLNSGQINYDQPVYILVNEETFSAASVFTSAFKGLPNVKIVGITTDGSSGNSNVLFLKNSAIRIRISTMLSFQRNGKTLDGNGTTPDFVISVSENQVLSGSDDQLLQLIDLINVN